MKYIALYIVFLLILNFPTQAQPCDCSLALRYDIFKSNKNYYNEMILAKEIDQENFKDIKQEAGANLSLFGIKIGANGENIQKIKDAYRERLYTKNVVHDLEAYESTTTSAGSYTAYIACLNICYGDEKKLSGIYANVLDNENKGIVKINIHYRDHSGVKPVRVRSQVGNKRIDISIPAGEDRLIIVPRINREAFKVILETNIFPPKEVQISRYRPISALMTIEYTDRVRIDTILRYGPVPTQNNDNVDNSDKKEAIKTVRYHIENAAAIYPSYPDGVTIVNDMRSSAGTRSTRAVFKATPPPGFQLTGDNKIECTAEDQKFCNNWVEWKIKYRNDAQMYLYSQNHYSRPVSLSLVSKAYTYRNTYVQAYSFTTGTEISFQVPKSAQNPMVHWNESYSLPLGQEDQYLEFISPQKKPLESDNDLIYRYRIKKFVE